MVGYSGKVKWHPLAQGQMTSSGPRQGGTMDPRFEPYFRARIEQIRREAITGQFVTGDPAGAPSWFSPEQVISAIDQGIESFDRTGPRLRSDGELLLYLAFTELVAGPVTAVRRGEVNPGDVLTDIATDVSYIRQNALRQGAGSVYDVVDATSRSWNYLKTGGLELWD
jgi:hypothetical protein